MMPMVINQLIQYLEKMEDLQICIDILNDLLTVLTKGPDVVVCIKFIILFNFYPFIHSVIHFSFFNHISYLILNYLFNRIPLA